MGSGAQWISRAGTQRLSGQERPDDASITVPKLTFDFIHQGNIELSFSTWRARRHIRAAAPRRNRPVVDCLCTASKPGASATSEAFQDGFRHTATECDAPSSRLRASAHHHAAGTQATPTDGAGSRRCMAKAPSALPDSEGSFCHVGQRPRLRSVWQTLGPQQAPRPCLPQLIPLRHHAMCPPRLVRRRHRPERCTDAYQCHVHPPQGRDTQ